MCLELRRVCTVRVAYSRTLVSGGATRIRLPKPHSGRGPIIQDRSCKEVTQLVVIALKVGLRVKLSRVGDEVVGVSPPVSGVSP